MSKQLTSDPAGEFRLVTKEQAMNFRGAEMKFCMDVLLLSGECDVATLKVLHCTFLFSVFLTSFMKKEIKLNDRFGSQPLKSFVFQSCFGICLEGNSFLQLQVETKLASPHFKWVWTEDYEKALGNSSFLCSAQVCFMNFR